MKVFLLGGLKLENPCNATKNVALAQDYFNMTSDINGKRLN